MVIAGGSRHGTRSDIGGRAQSRYGSRRGETERRAAPRGANACLQHPAVVVRESGRSSIPETAVIESTSRGVLDTPPSRGTTTVCGVSVVHHTCVVPANETTPHEFLR